LTSKTFPYKGLEFTAQENGRLYVPAASTGIPAFTLTRVVGPRSGRLVDALLALVGGPEDGGPPISLLALGLSLRVIRHFLGAPQAGERTPDHVHFRFERVEKRGKVKFELSNWTLYGEWDARYCPRPPRRPQSHR